MPAWDKTFRAMKVLGRSFLDSQALRSLGFKAVGAHVEIHETANIVGLERVAIGDHVRIDAFVNVVCGASGHLTLGSRIHIGAQCHIGAGAGVTMEDFSTLAQGCRLYSVSDDYSGETLTNPMVPAEYRQNVTGPIRIGRHVIVGSGSVVLPGVTLGEGTAVGALSLVKDPTEPWMICAGCPARALRPRSRKLLDSERRLLGET